MRENPLLRGLSALFVPRGEDGREIERMDNNEVADSGEALVMTRRTAMRALLALAVVGSVSGCKNGPENGKNPNKKRITSEMPELDENALTNQRILVYLAAYTKLTKTQILLVDQNFGIIGGGPIEIPREILALPTKEQREPAYQEWINGQREGAKAKYPGINLDLTPVRKDAEEPELISFRSALNIAGTNRTYFGSVAERAFSGKFDLVKGSLSSSGLPAGLQKLILGIPGVESGYSEEIPNSSTNAVGPWQVMDGLGIQLGLYRPSQPSKYVNKRVKRGKRTITTKILKPAVPGFDNRRDFEKTTAKILGHFKSQYAYFKKMPEVVNVMKTYGLSEEDFIFPLVIDSYHAGMGTVGRMVRWFNESEEEMKAAVEERFGKPPYGQDIYSFMSQKRTNQGADKNYFRRSRDYYAQVAAMAELLHRRANGQEVETEWPGEYAPPSGEVVDEVPVAKTPNNKISYDETGELKQELLDSDIDLKVTAFKLSEKAKLREKLNPDLRAWAERKRMKPMKDMAELDARSQKEGFKTLSENSSQYRLRGVGNGEGGSKNNMDYARVYQHVEEMINDAAEEVNRVAHEAGLPTRYSLRLIVTGAARTEAYQKALKAANASNVWSSHTLGNSVDISWLRCDIIDTKTNNFTMLIRNDELDKKLKLGALLEAALGRFLIDANAKDRTMALQESKGASTFHTMVLK